MALGTAIIIGAGSGLSASLARKLAARGHPVVLGARNVAKLEALVTETGAQAVAVDGSDPAAMQALFDGVTGRIDVAI